MAERSSAQVRAPQRFLLLAYRMPAKPTAGRVAVWRSLKKIGAVYLQDSVCVLPDVATLRHELAPVLERIDADGGGAIGGIGGAAFTIGGTGEFVSGISSELGYVALAAMIFGRWIPLRIAAATLLFGFAESLQTFFGLLNVPIAPPFLEMAPYLVTIFAVAGLVGRVRPPAADGQPYVKG